MILRMRYTVPVVLGVCVLWPIGWTEQMPDNAQQRSGPESVQTSDVAQHPVGEKLSRAVDVPATLVPLQKNPKDRDTQGLPNFLQIAEKIFTGGQPADDEAFACLSRHGIRTLVSVDGARPDVAAARKHGLRYVHIPVAYDGIDLNAGLSLARVVRDLNGPFYVHCHHGQHRAPSAAAIMCIVSGTRDSADALNILRRAGTSSEYAGLWRDVERYEIPAADVELPPLVEVAEADSLATAMAAIARIFENLNRCHEANWVPLNDHADLMPAQEALLLKERLHEAVRNGCAGYDAEFQIWLTEAEHIAENLEGQLKSQRMKEAGRSVQALRESCHRCHQQYRN